MNKLISAASKYRYQAKGFNLENFVFSLTSSGVGMQHVKRKKHSLSFTASAANDSVISSASQQFGLELIITRKLGLASLLARLPYMIGGLLGMAFSVFFVVYMTSFITKVEFIIPSGHTCQNQSSCIFTDPTFSQIKEFLVQNGIVENQRFSGKTKQIQTKVMAEFKLVENCSITKHGTIIIVELAEAKAAEEEPYTQIVAETNCIITSITTFSGIAKVKAGDVVVKGQVLVESDGDILPRASITARVWHYATEIFDQNQAHLVRTGNTQTFTSLEIMGATLYGGGTTSFALYQTEEQVNYVCKNTFLPIICRTTTYYEVELQSTFVDFESVKDQVLSSAKARALSDIQDVSSILECNYSIVKEGSLVRVDCYVTVEGAVGIRV